MSEDAQKTSKAAKKNKKRNSKKSGKPQEASNDVFDHQSMLAQLKTLLEEAKLNKEHARAATLRNQIWVLKDLVNGVRTQIPAEDLDKIIESIHSHFSPKLNSTSEEVKADELQILPTSGRLSATGSSSGDLDDRKLRNLRKKLNQIEALKERQEKGEKLEENQLEKIRSESTVKEEIRELEELLKGLLKC